MSKEALHVDATAQIATLGLKLFRESEFNGISGTMKLKIAKELSRVRSI
jgi:hypothetical protein